MITHQSGSAWDTLMTNASPVWPERVRPLLSTIVPEIWIEQSKLRQQHRPELRIQSQKQNKTSKLTFSVFLQGRELWHSNSKAALFFITVRTDECTVPRGGVGKPQKQRKGKVTETKAVSKKALGFTPPVPLEKTSPQIPQVTLVSCCSTSDPSDTPCLTLFYSHQAMGACLLHYWTGSTLSLVLDASRSARQSVRPRALTRLSLWLRGTGSARLLWNSPPSTNHRYIHFLYISTVKTARGLEVVEEGRWTKQVAGS